jgi:flagellar protein FlaG
MALDVSSIQTTSPIQSEGAKHAQTAVDQVAADQVAAAKAAVITKASESIPPDLRTAIRDIQRVSEAFNRRLSFSINEKLDQVVVKVIDNDTDKVVREIPPTELQHVYERIREAIGLLFDKSA